MIKHWTKEEEEKLLQLKNDGVTLAKIAEILGRTYEATRTRSRRLKARENPTHVGWTDEEVELLYEEYDYNELEKLIPSKTRRAIMSKCEKLGISKNFPGVKKAGGTLVPGRPSLLYLVDFGEFKKVGVCQTSLEERFKQDKPFKVLDTVEMSMRDALETEGEILRNMREFRVIGDIRRGGSECFKFDCTQLSDLI